MIRAKFLFFGVIFFTLKLHSACPPPMIQAVCQITKMDRTVEQGYLNLGTYGCFGLWMNGFLSYSDEKYLKPDYFMMDIKSIEFKDRIIVKRYGGKGNSSPRKKHIKYMSWKSNPTVIQPYLHLLENIEGELIYKVKSKLEREYVLSDSIRLFKNLNQYTFIPDDTEEAEFVDVAISDIAKITFLEKQEISNLAELINSGIEADSMANGPESSGDFQLPLWYHDIILNEKLLKQVNEHIKDYTLRY